MENTLIRLFLVFLLLVTGSETSAEEVLRLCSVPGGGKLLLSSENPRVGDLLLVGCLVECSGGGQKARRVRASFLVNGSLLEAREVELPLSLNGARLTIPILFPWAPQKKEAAALQIQIEELERGSSEGSRISKIPEISKIPPQAGLPQAGQPKAGPPKVGLSGSEGLLYAWVAEQKINRDPAAIFKKVTGQTKLELAAKIPLLSFRDGEKRKLLALCTIRNEGMSSSRAFSLEAGLEGFETVTVQGDRVPANASRSVAVTLPAPEAPGQVSIRFRLMDGEKEIQNKSVNFSLP